MGNKITIKYKEKEYEIEKKKDEQKVKPKGETNGTEIIVKNYEESAWNHTCECNGEKIEIKWGKGKHITIWGGTAILIVAIIVGSYFWICKKKPEKPEMEEN
ncbi:MAG: hypothetical protein I3274_04180 [Candidatus Moeniiplasma glomeromycotorum]|nr:hypothetical protein [Candidatus Moeniiplasma glomeromycotorum]MCE8167877.1 hypothetical protein [Candidatus Moeniiplasma glomeromycotorum]